MSAPLTRDIQALAAIFAASGAIHLAKPEAYEPLMPKSLPAHRELILGSGVAEILCAVGLVNPGTRRAAGWASFALLLAVYPGNLKMAMDAVKTNNTGFKAFAFGRLPLQLPMLRIAWKAARS